MVQWQTPEFRALRSWKQSFAAKEMWRCATYRKHSLASLKTNWPRFRDKIIAAQHAAQARPETKARKSAASKRMWANPDVATRMVEALARSSHYSRYEYLDRKGRLWTFKSGDAYELGFARWLDVRGLDWSYEPHVLFLSTGTRYLPDFFVREWESYVELKALWQPVNKAAQARQDGHSIVVLHGHKAIQRFMESQDALVKTT